ncbi:M28 family peptidase [Catalinimonas alkaloidigena]|uniref:M28 family peptidase n=1 Tax=Catalinimonas alkaloidigena TaxID=1075417 RepID=UPI0024065397|nr:M28 family peptidase [Catalinimonas alkaloidigena]
MRNQLLIVLSALTLLLSACQQDAEQSLAEKTTDTAPQEEIVVPAFNADSAYHFVQRQVDFGPRVPNTSAHLATANFLRETLENYGAEVQIQSFDAPAFDGTSLALQNIIASFNPDVSKRILLAAHWDSRPFADKDDERKHEPIDGANDGASGVGVLLELGRMFQVQPPEVGVDIILFDGEDYGEPEDYQESSESSNQVWWCLGSQYWAENKHKNNYMAYYGILLDMVGAEGAQFYREGVSMRAAPSIVKKVWGKAQELDHGRHFVYKNSPEIVDDHIYVNYNAKIPMIDIIDYAAGSEAYFPAYHHTHDDNMDIISKETLKAVGETVAGVVYHE